MGSCPSTTPIWVFFTMEEALSYFCAFKVCYIRDSDDLQIYSASVENFDEVGVGFAFLHGSLFVGVIYWVCLK